jgi:hypothetical protein
VTVEQENRRLRRLLADYVGHPLLYRDDGELQDSSEYPFIDFLRDAPEEIQRKLMERHLKKLFGEKKNGG